MADIAAASTEDPSSGVTTLMDCVNNGCDGGAPASRLNLSVSDG